MFQDHFGGKALVALALGAGLAGCGGGGGGSTPGDSITTQLSPACTGASCGATDATTYSGQGVGVWSYTNATVDWRRDPLTLAGSMVCVRAGGEDFLKHKSLGL